MVMNFSQIIKTGKAEFGSDAEIFSRDKYSCFYDGIKDCCSGSCANYQQCVAQQEGF